MNAKVDRVVFIDPAYEIYYQNKLFLDDPIINQDNRLGPSLRLKKYLSRRKIELMTADYLFNHSVTFQQGSYCSMGLLHDFSVMSSQYHVDLKYFFIFEPPVVKPDLYAALPMLTHYFEKVFVHNTHGDGYSLKNVDRSKLVKFFWPQPYSDVIEQYWLAQNRRKKIVIINSHHKPVSRYGELYSMRIKAMSALSKYDAVDLYGRNWKKLISRNTLWLPFLINRKRIMKVYRGSIESKYQMLSRYDFSLCFENMAIEGYMTEKLFDCLYAGTIPLYLGATDVEKYIPEDAYIDCRLFESWVDLWHYCKSLSEEAIQKMRSVGREFLRSKEFDKYYLSFERIFSETDV